MPCDGDSVEWRCEVCGFGPYCIDVFPVYHPCSGEGYDVASVVAMLPAKDRLLLGDRIEQLTKAIGLPTCAGCAARKEWINKAHAWLFGAG